MIHKNRCKEDNLPKNVIDNESYDEETVYFHKKLQRDIDSFNDPIEFKINFENKKNAFSLESETFCTWSKSATLAQQPAEESA